MFNFLDHRLLPKVKCSVPVMDNYEAENLISPKDILRLRGFLAYSVIRPPVHLEFEFLCPVNISYLVLNTSIGQQKCTGIEVFAKNSAADLYMQTYTSIAKAIYSESGVVFCDSKKYSKKHPPPHVPEQFHLCFLKSNTFRLFSNASSIKITIFRTEKSVPCLGSIKVFGKPSMSCSDVTVKTVHKIMDKRPAFTNGQQSAQDDNKGLMVPDDFKDDLTCEIMAVPMTLPSGKTVDRDTLDKHVQNEASFGRKPCDPFTGLNFTDGRKPVLNSALKNRIDMFMLLNSNDPIINGVKRTIGSVSGNCHKKFKRIEVDSNNLSDCCCSCKQKDILYVIPCKHIYCRSCLLNLDTSKCKVCQEPFVKSEAERYHHPCS